jgi:hypothetical protein
MASPRGTGQIWPMHLHLEFNLRWFLMSILIVLAAQNVQRKRKLARSQGVIGVCMPGVKKHKISPPKIKYVQFGLGICHENIINWFLIEKLIVLTTQNAQRKKKLEISQGVTGICMPEVGILN